MKVIHDSVLRNLFERSVRRVSFMAVSDDVQAMIDTMTEAMGDAAKHDKGVDAAGRRLRGTLSAIAKECKNLRGKVQDERNNR